MEMPINAQLKEAVSEKSGKVYQYVEIQLTATYFKKVFLEQSELELIKLAYTKKAQ
jgi:hypothetical protein